MSIVSGSLSFGHLGTIIGIFGDQIEVLFDKEFKGGIKKFVSFWDHSYFCNFLDLIWPQLSVFPLPRSSISPMERRERASRRRRRQSRDGSPRPPGMNPSSVWLLDGTATIIRPPIVKRFNIGYDSDCFPCNE